VIAVLYSGVNSPSSLTVGSGYTFASSQRDFGNQSAVMEYGAKSGASVVANFGQGTTDDTAMVAAAIQELPALPSLIMPPRVPA
jgi:hypothetical protein